MENGLTRRVRQAKLLPNIIFFADPSDKSLKLAVAVECQGRKRINVELGRDLKILLHVHLKREQLCTHFSLEQREFPEQAPAGAAPRLPELHQDGERAPSITRSNSASVISGIEEIMWLLIPWMRGGTPG